MNALSDPRHPGEEPAGNMTCREFESRIRGFLDDDLPDEVQEEMLRHLEQCPACREELSIRLLVESGLRRLETGGNFNLKDEYKAVLAEAEHRIRQRARRTYLGYAAETAAVVLTAAVFFIALLR